MKSVNFLGILILMVSLVTFGLAGCAEDDTAPQYPSGNNSNDNNDDDDDNNDDDDNDDDDDWGDDGDVDDGDVDDGDDDPVDVEDDDNGSSNTGVGASLMPATNGWLDETDMGFQGAWYTYSDADDGGNSTISPAIGGEFENNGSELCVSGTAGQVVDEEYATYWGAGFGMDLCANREDQEPSEEKYTISSCPFNTSMGSQFKGVTFDISGDWGTELRVSFAEDGRTESAYVVVADGASSVEALVADADVGYDPGNPTNSDSIIAVQFQIPTNGSSDVDFDFCISNVEAIME